MNSLYRLWILPLLVASESALSGDLFTFSSIYEPSGVAHLGQGEFMVVEDEPERPFHWLQLNQNGLLIERGIVQLIGDPIRLNDLEGVTFDGRYLYAITSHSLTKKAKTGKDRSLLARFEYADGHLHDARQISDLKAVMLRLFTEAFAGQTPGQIESELNIEALAWSPQDESLYIGFREPLNNGLSAVMRIQSPAPLFEQQSSSGLKPQLFWLDLQAKGIRSMNWDTRQSRFVIVAGRKGLNAGFDLWQWKPDEGTALIKLSDTDTSLPEGTEGLTYFDGENQSGVLLVIDDGSQKKSRPAHYQLITK